MVRPEEVPAMPEQDYPREVCAHRSGIERVEVTQPQGQKYEWWRCLMCHCEFRPTGQVRFGDGPGEVR